MPLYKPTTCYHCKVEYIPILPKALALCPDCARLPVSAFETKCDAFNKFLHTYAKLPDNQRRLGHDGDFILIPPNHDYGYQSTPANALTFATMCVDGVHHALLKIDDEIRDHSPAIQISPMDSNDLIVIAPTFLDYLADASATPAAQIHTLLNAENSNELITFLNQNFDPLRLLEEIRAEKLNTHYSHLIQRRPGTEFGPGGALALRC